MSHNLKHFVSDLRCGCVEDGFFHEVLPPLFLALLGMVVAGFILGLINAAI